MKTMLYGRGTITLVDVKSALNSKYSRTKLGIQSTYDQVDGLFVKHSSGGRVSNKDWGYSNGISRFMCHYYHKFCHHKSKCLILKNEETSSSNVVSVVETTNDSNIVLAVCGSIGRFGDKWVLDSACTFDITPRKDWSTTYESCNNDFILVVNNIVCDIVRIKIKMFDETFRILSNVWHIPSMGKKYYI